MPQFFIIPAVDLFLDLQLFHAAAIAESVMAADRAAALRAFPFAPLPAQKRFNAVLPDELQVLHHAHAISGSIALIDMLQVCAGEISTLMAVHYLPAGEKLASFLEEGALLIPWPAAGAVHNFNPFAFEIIAQGKVAAAYAAVHTAGSNQFLFHSAESG